MSKITRLPAAQHGESLRPELHPDEVPGATEVGDASVGQNVRAARLKGLPEHVVILRHVLRPALVSIITVAGVAFGSLLSGTVLVENIFSWPGVGQYAYHSAINLDLPAIMGVSLFVAVVYIVVNLVVDLLYGVIDPRIRLS